jgi:hypothetical protein
MVLDGSVKLCQIETKSGRFSPLSLLDWPVSRDVTGTYRFEVTVYLDTVDTIPFQL